MRLNVIPTPPIAWIASWCTAPARSVQVIVPPATVTSAAPLETLTPSPLWVSTAILRIRPVQPSASLIASTVFAVVSTVIATRSRSTGPLQTQQARPWSHWPSEYVLTIEPVSGPAAELPIAEAAPASAVTSTARPRMGRSIRGLLLTAARRELGGLKQGATFPGVCQVHARLRPQACGPVD